jgi:SPP1 family phage portal protein
VAKFIYILKNYGGQDLGEFIRDLKEHLAIKVTSDGGVDKLQADLNIDAVMAFLDKQRRDVFDFASAVDTKDPDLGNASGTAINFRYMDLDADCVSLGNELKDTFQRLKMFIDVYFQLTGKGDFTKEQFDVIFNVDLPVNETDVINNVRNSEGIISKRTQLQNHPWVQDVEEEVTWIEEEKKKAMEEFGNGLFDDALGANAEANKGDGENGGGVNDEQ